MLEVTAGQAKYEHVHHGIVWRIPRLPKEGQGAYTSQNLSLKLPLTSFDQMPDSFYEYAHVEYWMPSTTVSHTTLRSISISNTDEEKPAEKFVRYLARYEYKVNMNMSVNLHDNVPVPPLFQQTQREEDEDEDEESEDEPDDDDDDD